MQSLQARIDSFQKARRVKRNPAKSSSTAASVKWPHPNRFKANPNTLAEAGFFFNPSWDDRDSVACFLCGKELSDWDADDDPFEIHYSKCRSSCAWAIVRCGLIQDMDVRGRFVFGDKMRVPSSKAMEKARLETFGDDWWPHDSEPGHGATSAKMAQAGFVYTPQATGDDTVTCLYCNLSLGGWEMGDDPAQEHRRRSGKSGANANSPCPFLASSSKPTRSKAVQPSLPPKKPPPVDTTDQQSEDELATVEITDPPPPPPRSKRGRARSTTSTARRKTKGTRGRPAKSSAPAPKRSPSPSQSLSRTQDEEDARHVPMDVDAPLPDDPEPPPIVLTRPSNESQQDKSTTLVNESTQSLPDGAVSPPSPSLPDKPNPPPGTSLPLPDPIVSLSPTGQPTVASSQSLTQQERTLSLEQWIRQEIDVSYEKLWADGQRQIELFKTKAAEIRKCIDDL